MAATDDDGRREVAALKSLAVRALGAVVDLCVACGADAADGQAAVNRMPFPLYSGADPGGIAPLAEAAADLLRQIARRREARR